MRGKPAVPDFRLFSIYAVISAWLVFWLPYFVPLTPTASISYLFGYNNRAGILLLLLITAAGALFIGARRLDFQCTGSSQPISRKVIVLALVAALLGCVGMYWLAGRYGGFGESSYEIDRIWLTSIGKRPYIDFEWPFGVALLYGPLILHKLIHLSIPAAYYVFWALNCLLGVWLLYLVIDATDYPSSRKTSIFLLLYCAWFFAIMNMGTHYALVRYALPLYFILVIYKLGQSAEAFDYAISNAASFLFTVILLLYSPETAIAFVLAAIFLFILLGRKPRMHFFVALGIQLTTLAALFDVALKLHLLDTVRASGTGADSFPIIPSGHILLLFAALFVCASYAYQRMAFQPMNDNSIALIAFSIPMLPAALGRCDPGHVIFNGLGLLLACLLYASCHERAWKYSRTAFIVILIVLPVPGGLWLSLPSLGKCGLAALGAAGEMSVVGKSAMGLGNFYISHFAPPPKRQRWEERLNSLLQGSVSNSPDLSKLYPGWQGGFLAPFGYKPNGFATDLTQLVDYGRYEGLENANTVTAINEKISEIRENPGKALLLPDQFESSCTFNVHTERQQIELLFAAPFFKSAAHRTNLHEALCQYIEQNYTLAVPSSNKTFFYALWIHSQEAKNLFPRFSAR